MLFAVVSGLAVLRRGDELPAGVDWVPLTAAAGLAVCALAFRAMTRASNRAADHRAAWLTDAGLLVAALAEQERRRGEPPDRSWVEDFFLHGPCAARRAAAIAGRYAWSPDDVGRLLAAPVGALPLRYNVPLPPIPERPRRNPFGVPTIVLMVALPLAFAFASEAVPAGQPRTIVLMAGLVGVPLLWGAVLRCVNVRMNGGWKRELDRELRAEGIEPNELSGVLVAFAPDREAHNYNGTPQWDLGYLIPAGNRLLYIGRRVRVAVPWKTSELSLAPNGLTRRLTRVVVTWGRGAPDAGLPERFDKSSPIATHGSGVFSAWPAPRLITRPPRGPSGLLARLQEWRDCGVEAGSVPASWANLPPPPATPPGAKLMRESMRVRLVVGSIGTLGGLVLMIGSALGLPSRATWYASAVVAVTVLAYTLPPILLLPRQRPPME